MQGFGIQTKNINELISRIEKEISYITKNTDKNIIVLNNKLSLCSNELAKLKNEFNNLKEYAETEYNALRDKIASYDEQIEELKSQINKVTVKSVEGDTCASGITPMSVYKETGLTYPIYAKYAEKDTDGNVIQTTYAKQEQVNNIQSKLNNLSGVVTELKSVSVKHRGDINYSAVSSLNPNENDVYRITGVSGWKATIPNVEGHVPLFVGNEDHLIFNGSYWKIFSDNTQTDAISQEFINSLDWGV